MARSANDRFLHLEWHEGDSWRWAVPASVDLTGGRGDLFGGCAVGAAISGLERCSGRPLAWVTAQFLAPARPPERIEFTVEELVEGRNLTQAVVRATVADRLVLSLEAAFGARPVLGVDRRWVSAPIVPPPSACPPPEALPGPRGLRSRFDCRLVPAKGGDASESGLTQWWFRADDAHLGDPMLLAVLLDFVPLALSSVIGRPVFGASLDNTMRVVERVDTDWVLVEFAVESVAAGIGHIASRAWSQDGVLLATGSQSCVISERRVPPRAED